MTDLFPFPGPSPMLARIRRDELPPRLAEMWDAAMRDRDEAVLIEVAGNAPEVIEWYYDRFYGELFHQGRVEPRLKQLARLKLSTLHGCAFCNRGNEKAALAAGVTSAQIAALAAGVTSAQIAALAAGVTSAQIAALADPDAAIFDARERALLHLCEAMTLANMSGHLGPRLHGDLAAAGFSDGDIFELGVVMAVLTGMAKFLFVFDLVSREAVCPIAPPPRA